MFRAFEVSADEDLSQFSRLLWQKKISHRIFESGNMQAVGVSRQQDIPVVAELFRQWQHGQVMPSEQDSGSLSGFFSGKEAANKLVRAILHTPVTMSLVIACIVMAVLAPLGSFNALARAFMFPDFSYGTSIIVVNDVLESFSLLTFLKMIGPIFLHGGLLHLAFNMLWLWEFGRRIEVVQNSWKMALLVVILALFSNTIQYLYGPLYDNIPFALAINFGGMSGVVYGLFAYIWMWQLFDPGTGLKLPPALVFFILLSLFILTMIGIENIADAAHVGGLLTGVLYGATFATLSRIRRSMKQRNPG